jgi:ferredoxin
VANRDTRHTARTLSSTIRKIHVRVVLLGFPVKQDYRGLMTPKPEKFQVALLLSNDERSIQAGWDEHIWDAAFAAGIVLPAMCHQGYCLTCAGRLEGSGEVDQSDSLVYLPEDREAGFVLLCTGKPRSRLRIRTHQQKQMREFRKHKGLLAPYSWSNEE